MNDRTQDIEIESERLRLKDEAAAARWAGVLTALIGTIAILVIAILIDPTKNQRLVVVILILSGCGWFWLPIGLVSGWFAHKYFAGTQFPPTFVAVIVTSIAVLSILGWGLVASLSG